MILFVHRPTYIRVIRLDSIGKRSDNLGKIYRTEIRIGTDTGLSDEWVWTGRYRLLSYGTINHSEKRQIIGLLDDLNGVRYRPQSDMLARWNELIGPAMVDMLANGPTL